MEKISFVIPCYRSQNTIEKVVDDIYQVMDEHKEYETEIVLVNDIAADYYYHPDHSERNVLVWIIPETKVLIYVQGFQSEAELVEIAESVAPVLSLPTNQK